MPLKVYIYPKLYTLDYINRFTIETIFLASYRKLTAVKGLFVIVYYSKDRKKVKNYI